MRRKRTKSASRKWFAVFSTLEASRTLPFGLRIPQQNASVHVDPWSYGKCRMKVEL